MLPNGLVCRRNRIKAPTGLGRSQVAPRVDGRAGSKRGNACLPADRNRARAERVASTGGGAELRPHVAPCRPQGEEAARVRHGKHPPARARATRRLGPQPSVGELASARARGTFADARPLSPVGARLGADGCYPARTPTGVWGAVALSTMKFTDRRVGDRFWGHARPT